LKKLIVVTVLVILAGACNEASQGGDFSAGHETAVRDSTTALQRTPEEREESDIAPELKILATDTIRTEHRQTQILLRVYEAADGADCGDPLCGEMVLMRNGTAERNIKLPMVDGDTLFLRKRMHPYYVFEYYSSPAGMIRLYVIDAEKMRVFASGFTDETETIEEESFDFDNNTFKVTDETRKPVTKTLHVL